MELGKYLNNVRNLKPVVYNITNYVTVNDVANALLAINASPIMSDDANEAKDLMTIASGLNVNIGTLNERTIDTMVEASKLSNQMKKPVVLDPVAVGASKYRIDVVKHLINHADYTVIKGNASEIETFNSWTKKERGVDVAPIDLVTKDNYRIIAPVIRKLSLQYKAIIVLTGEVDIVSDGHDCFALFNGKPEMTSVTGLGCMLSGITTAFISVADNKLEATTASVAALGIAGELARQKMNTFEGNVAYRNHIIDALYNLQAADIDNLIKIESI